MLRFTTVPGDHKHTASDGRQVCLSAPSSQDVVDRIARLVDLAGLSLDDVTGIDVDPVRDIGYVEHVVRPIRRTTDGHIALAWKPVP